MNLLFIDRMQKEYNELDTKITKLEKALKSLPLDKKEKELLIFQKEYMKKYREILHSRINYEKEKYKI